MPRGATCSRPSKPITIVGRSTPLSATSPQSGQTGKPHNPVSTFPGEGQTTIYPGEKDRRHRTKRVRVRAIEYRPAGVADAEQLYRLGRTISTRPGRLRRNWPPSITSG